MRSLLIQLLLGKDLLMLITKYIEYKSARSAGGKELTNGEKAYLAKLATKIGERLILILNGKNK